MCQKINIEPVRRGIHDIWWNAYMVSGAKFTPGTDIPFCPTTATCLPSMIITYEEAKAIYRRELRRGNKGFLHMAHVCFYEDDKFDGKNGIWFNSSHAYKILCHFAGIITPDFSTNQDFPIPLKEWNTYRMRAFGYWYGSLCKHSVINNVRWGTEETYCYCFDGIPKNSVVAVGTVGGSPRKKIDRRRFESGFDKMIEILQPRTIVVYGSSNYPCFLKVKDMGIEVLTYQSRAAKSYKMKRCE